MNTLHFLKSNKIIILVLAVITIFSAVAGSIAVFTDRANRTTTVQVSSFDDKGYAIERTAQEGYFTAGETVEVTLTESNEKSKDITSEITMTAAWDSPVSDIDPWTNTVITFDDENVSYTVNEDDTISFTLPKHELTAGSSNSECILRFKTPSDLATTGNLKFSFKQIELKNKGWNTKYDNSDLSDLDCGFGIAWNISQNQTTSLGNPNRDVIAVLVESDKDAEYGLQIMKNPYSNDDNTNNGTMMDWTAKDQTPWADYTIVELVIGENVTTIGDYAFAGEIGIQAVTLPNTISHIGTQAFDGSGLSGELIIPASVSTIESLAFGNLPEVTAITFIHGSDDTLTLPDNESEEEAGQGAFYVPAFVKTDFNFNGNADAEGYNWVIDNRMKAGISKIVLNYDEVKIGKTADPVLTIYPDSYDEYQSIKYEVTSGGDYVEVDENSGVVTGKAIGNAAIKVTIVDANGDAIQATATVSVTAVSITSVSLSYEDVAVGSTVEPSLTYAPDDAVLTSKQFEITTGSEYATIDESTGAITGKADGVVLVKVTLTDTSGNSIIATDLVTIGAPTNGTRYVWNKHNKTYSYSVNQGSSLSYGTSLDFSNYNRIRIYTGLYVNSSGNIQATNSSTTTIPMSTNVWGELTIPSGQAIYYDGNYYISNGSGEVSASSQTFSNDTDYKYEIFVSDTSGGFKKAVASQGYATKGDLIATLSSNSPSAYGSGESGDYWFDYLGADCIDPDAVTYSEDSVIVGDTITVTAAPSTKNVYGGTISYRYEYSTDGGTSWTTAETTTETSLEITVPDDADSFIARVRANDSWGFTSSVYVYGGSITVIPPYVGIESIALTYSNVAKGSTVDPTLTINPSNYDAYQSIKYEVTSGSSYVTVDSSTGIVTGVAAGTATIQVTVVDAGGTTKTATADVTVVTGIDSVVLSYENVSVGGTVNPTVTIDPSDYSAYQSISYSIYSGTSYASVDSSTGVVTGKAAGQATIKITIMDATGQTVEGYCVVTVGSPTAASRYIWSKYNIGTSTETTYSYSWTTSSVNAVSTERYGRIYYSSSAPSLDSSTGSITYPSSRSYFSTQYENVTSVNISAGNVYYFWSPWYKESEQGYDSIVKVDLTAYEHVEYTISNSPSGALYEWGSIEFTGYTADDYSELLGTYWGGETVALTEMYGKKVASSTTVDAQGSTSYGYVSSTSSSTYASNGVTGSYWYVYQGSDKIDPTAVSYSTTSPTAGSSITASVTAGSNTYGGTISYTYQYSTNGGLNWTTATTTTATSYAFTVPSDANSFMVRVRAKDNYGFTSSKYVYGTNLVVN